MRLTFHIGSHKSGSTAVQKLLKISAERLAAHGILYPLDLFENYPDQHSELVGLVQRSGEEDLSVFFGQLRARAERAGARHVVLSGEDMSTGLAPAAVHRLVNAARSQFAEVDAVMVVRAQRDYLLSHFNHMLRHDPRPIGAEEFAARMHFDPAEVTARWTGALGEGRFATIPYEAPGGPSLLERFFSTVLHLAPDPAALAACQRVLVKGS